MAIGIPVPRVAGLDGILPGMVGGIGVGLLARWLPMGVYAGPVAVSAMGYLIKNEVLMTLGGYELGKVLIAGWGVGGTTGITTNDSMLG